jgi:sulfatase maturation enzyme AslB (radical SAM superfamily)
MNCKYCYSKSEYKTRVNAIKKSIKQILERYNIKKVTITGGEPLIEYDFVKELIKDFKKRRIGAGIITNGSLLDQTRIEELRQLGAKVRISIDGFSANCGKRPSQRLVELIRKNTNFLGEVSKVITKENVRFLYKDFLYITSLGFRDVDLIPQMYVYWNDKNIETMLKNVRKVIRYSLKNNIHTNFSGTPDKKRYHECDKIRVLPDGDISFCNSLNSFGKCGYIKSKNINEFKKFKKSKIDYALKEYNKNKWFDNRYLKEFCMIDYFYYNHISENNSKLIISAVNLFSKLNKIIEEETHGSVIGIKPY